jgi:FkbM family methyltransferase
MTRLRDLMTLTSRARYLLWRTGAFGDAVAVRLTTGERIILERSMLMGASVAYEIFVSKIYRSPRWLDSRRIKRIVDVGANVGFSVAYWGAQYPHARIDAFEPHPAHIATLQKTIDLNHLSDRVAIHPAAIGVSSGVFQLRSAGVCSTLEKSPEVSNRDFSTVMDTIDVPVVDFYSEAGSDQIDLLKMDCEGAEYDVLMDSRFADIDAAAMVIEWHATTAHPQAEIELIERLRNLRWDVLPTAADNSYPIPDFGILRAGVVWAYR